MRCSQLETRLNDLLDRREDPRLDPEITAHTTRCGRCRRVAAAYAALTDGATALADESAEHYADDAVALSRFGSTFRRNLAATIWAVAAAALFYLTAVPSAPNIAKAPAAPTATAVVRQPVDETPTIFEFARATGRVYVGLLDDAARGVDGAFSIVAAVPPAEELLEPVLFADGSLLQQIGNEWIPAAGETLHAVERAFSDEPSVRS